MTAKPPPPTATSLLLKQLIESIIREEFSASIPSSSSSSSSLSMREAAVNARDLTNNEVAVVVLPWAETKNLEIVLYDRARLISLFDALTIPSSPSRPNYKNVLYLRVLGLMTNSMFSYIKGESVVDKRFPNTHTVSLSSAEKGYGPITYDLLMASVYPEWIMSDRENVTGQARAVWRHMLTKRPDIEHELIPIYAKIISLLKDADGNPETQASYELPELLEEYGDELSHVIKGDPNINPDYPLIANIGENILAEMEFKEDSMTLIKALTASPLAYRYRLKDGFQKSPYLKPLYDNHKKTVAELSKKEIIISMAKQDRITPEVMIQRLFNQAGIEFFEMHYAGVSDL